MTVVAPYVGAWIETSLSDSGSLTVESLPTWDRGLKHKYEGKWCRCDSVAPYVGAWIETINISLENRDIEVAPYVGAWIET